MPGQPLDFRSHILIVDDDPLILNLLEASVEAFGYRCTTASDGQEAVELLKLDEFAMVITDMTMPRLDGMALLKHIKEHYPRLDVIVVTGYTETFCYTEVIKAGASDFISKPFNIDELEAKISRVAREQRLIRKLEHLSMCDVLTDLYNRRCFDIKLREEVPRAHRQGYPVFLALIDVDGFKAYNDKYGHQAGDVVLQAIGHGLIRCTRESVDWSFRYGGDEFAVIIPYASIEQVMRIAERILQYHRDHHPPETGLSIGLAQFVRHPGRSWDGDIEDLINRADKALYQSKKEHGNRVVCDPSIPTAD
jgi:diguanylate cyclase (GGDEF)-like protein